MDEVELWLLRPVQVLGLAPLAGAWLGAEDLEGFRGPRQGPAYEGWLGRQVALRAVLADYLRADPRTLHLRREKGGKPCLAGDQGPRFSTSSSGGWWLAAFSDREVGVDLEFVGPGPEPQTVAQCYFSESELACLQAARSPRERQSLFHRFWTRKEALLKLRGVGLSGLAALSQEGSARAYWLEDLDLLPDCSASLAMRQAPSWVRLRRWEGSGADPRYSGLRETGISGRLARPGAIMEQQHVGR